MVITMIWVAVLVLSYVVTALIFVLNSNLPTPPGPVPFFLCAGLAAVSTVVVIARLS